MALERIYVNISAIWKVIPDLASYQKDRELFGKYAEPSFKYNKHEDTNS